MNINNTKIKLLEKALTDIYLEALDFKNIVPYPISDDGKFTTSSGASGKVLIQNVENDLDEIELPEIVMQSYDFYKRKKPMHSKIYNFAYTIDGSDTQAKKTNYKEILEILLTVMKYLKNFIEKTKPFAVVILPMDKLGGLSTDLQKKLIYDRMISDNIPKEYSVDKASVDEIEGKVIYRKTLPNK